jgi:hypothetical protein
MVNYIKDENLIYHVKEYDVVLVGTTINNSLGNGFQKDVERSFKYVSEANKRTIYGDKNKYGTVLAVNGEPVFCLCYIYSARTNPSTKPDVLDYDALRKCLYQIDNNFQGKKIATTLIGASEFDGGGNPDKVKEIIESSFQNCDIDVYDFKQSNYRVEDAIRYNNIVKLRTDGKITREQYEQLKKEDLWRRYRGIYEKMPEGLSYLQLKEYIKNDNNEENEGRIE